jgi:hypothetical protein
MNCELRPIILGMCCLVCISTPFYLYLPPLLNLSEMNYLALHKLYFVYLSRTVSSTDWNRNRFPSTRVRRVRPAAGYAAPEHTQSRTGTARIRGGVKRVRAQHTRDRRTHTRVTRSIAYAPRNATTRTHETKARSQAKQQTPDAGERGSRAPTPRRRRRRRRG